MGKFNGNLLQFMRMRSLDVEGLAIESGVSAKRIDGYIHLGKKGDLGEARDLARALNVSVDMIYDKDEEDD